MKSFLLNISSPEGNLFSGDVTMLTVRGTEGELAVMADHIPFVSYVTPCDCKVEFEDGSERTGHTEGGILTVGKDKTILLSGSFIWKNEKND